MKKIVFLFIILLGINSPVLAQDSSNLAWQALHAEGEGRWQDAVDIYRGILKQNPNLVNLWIRIADIEYRLKNFPSVIDAYKQAIKVQPNIADFHSRLSQTYAELNQPQEAFVEVKEAVRLDPNNVNYLKNQATIAKWVGDTNTAKESYLRILKA